MRLINLPFLNLLPLLTSAIVLSPSAGNHGVAKADLELTDHSRLDPYAESPIPRRLMISAFTPAGLVHTCSPVTTPYMPPSTAALYDAMYASLGLPNGTFETLNLSLCKNSCSSSSHSYPLVVFSPGLGDSRLTYSLLAQSLASRGFRVITIDHPYDASIVTFPDDLVALAADIETDGQIEAALKVRVADVRFVITQLSNTTIAHRLSQPALYPQEPVLMFGHSLGGATAAAAMLADRRIIAGVNLDGTFFGEILTRSLGCPFLVFSHEGKNLSTDASWSTAWPNFRGTKGLETLEGSAHGTFTDFPVVAHTLGVNSSDLAGLLGTIGAERSMEIVTEYLAQFFRFAVGSGRAPLVPADAKKRFPEVKELARVEKGRCGTWRG